MIRNALKEKVLSKQTTPRQGTPRRLWTPEEEKQLEALCNLRPHLPWPEIGRLLGRSPNSAKQHSLRRGIRRGGHPAAKEPCRKTGERRRWGVPGCECESCEARRSTRRRREIWACAGCGGVNVIVGSGTKQTTHLLENAPPEVRPA